MKWNRCARPPPPVGWIDLDDAEVGAVVLVPLHDAALRHARGLDGGHLVEAPRRNDDAARVLPEVARQAAHRLRQLEQRGDARCGGIDAGLS